MCGTRDANAVDTSGSAQSSGCSRAPVRFGNRQGAVEKPKTVTLW